MTGNIDPKVLGKYKKVRALWERTQGHEKEAAARILAQLQNSYPGIEQQCQQHNEQPQVGPLPSWREAMMDAIELLAGARTPDSVLEKYLSYIDAIEHNQRPRHTERNGQRPRLKDFIATTVSQSAAGVKMAIEVNQKGAAFFERAMSEGVSPEELDEVGDEIGRLAKRMFLNWVSSIR